VLSVLRSLHSCKVLLNVPRILRRETHEEMSISFLSDVQSVIRSCYAPILTSPFPPPPPQPQGGFLGIQLDESGRLAESSIGNVAILTPQGILRTPPFENILAGTTVKRLWELAEETLKPQGEKQKGEGRRKGGRQGSSLFCLSSPTTFL
jgi:hypothetical protein